VIYFAGFGAVTVPLDPERIEYRSDWEQFVLFFSGSLTSFGLAIGGLAWQAGHAGDANGKLFAGMNLAVGAFNLIPFGRSDGDRALTAVCDGLNERDGALMAAAVCVAAVYGFGTVAAHAHLPTIVVRPVLAALVIIAAWRIMRPRDPDAWQDPSVMSRARALACGVALVLLLGASGVLSRFV